MQKDSYNTKGFTLIELLVVIAVIALLLAVLVPSLGRAKEVSRRLYCMSSTRMLTSAWHSYAADNKDKLAEAKTADVSYNAATGVCSWSFSSSVPNPTWVGIWRGSLDNLQALEGAIRIGTFYPYNETLDIYRCTNHQWYARGDESGKRIRSYSIVDSMNGTYLKTHSGGDASVVGGVPFKRLSEIPNTGKQIVFMDEGRETSEGWTIYPDREQWWDLPPIQHDNGGVMSFADNHAEYWKWEDKRTMQIVKYLLYSEGTPIDRPTAAVKNRDFQRLQHGVWGTHRGNYK